MLCNWNEADGDDILCFIMFPFKCWPKDGRPGFAVLFNLVWKDCTTNALNPRGVIYTSWCTVLLLNIDLAMKEL